MKVKVRNALLSALVLTGTVLAGGGTAQAESASAERSALPGVTAEGRAYLDSLSPSDRAEFERTQLVSEITVQEGAPIPVDDAARASLREAQAAGVEVSPRASGCWTYRSDWQARSPLGNVLYTVYHVGGWCGNGSVATQVSNPAFGGETATPGWSYNGRINNGQGIVYQQGRSYSQFKFTLKAGPVTVQEPTPCVRVIGYGNGGGTHDSTCGIY